MAAKPRGPLHHFPPPDLDPQGRRLWIRIRAELEAQGTFQIDQHSELLSLYARSLQRARLAHERISARVAAGDPSAFHALGSARQLAVHPDVLILRQAEADAAVASDRLILSPSAQLRAKFEQDQAPDELDALGIGRTKKGRR
jgi:phage terminase small subunit